MPTLSDARLPAAVPVPGGGASRRPDRFHVRWRTVECWVIGGSLFFYTGGVLVLVFSGPDGNLTAVGQKAMQALVLPVYLMTLLVALRRRGQILAALRRNLPIALLLLLPFLSVLWSISPSITLRRALALVMSVLLSYLIAVRFTPRQFLVLVTAVLGACMMLSLLLAVAAPGLASMPAGHEASGLRGIFNHKNVLGWNAAVAAIASAMLAADRGTGLRRPAIIVLLASIACLMLSRSVTSLVMAMSGGFFVAFYMALTRSRRMGRVVLILGTVQIVTVMALSINLLLGLLLEGTEKDVSLTGRVPLWALVDDAISRRFLLGYGYQAFWTQGSGDAWAIWTKVAWIAPHAHNGYRDTLLSLGIVGTALLLVVILRAIRNAAFLQCRFPGEGWLWPNVLICVFLSMNLTESVFLAQNSFLFIIFMAALIMVSVRRPAA